MSVPKYFELYTPFLETLHDCEIHTLKEIIEYIRVKLSLKEEDVQKKLPSGNQTVLVNRVGWCRTYLKKAGLIVAVKRGSFKITDEGLKLIKSGVNITDKLLYEKYPSFAEFKIGKKQEEIVTCTDNETETPQEVFERVYHDINEQLADELLTEIINQTPDFFEKLVVDLMKNMGYGDGFVTKTTGDAGVDGIIYEDKLGFNLIYIQAKKWKIDTVISRPEIQKFAGAMMGPPKVEKGIFITTAKFSQGAIDYAKAQHIILVDGQKLTELMIEYNLGVSTQKVYAIKRVDTDYFIEE